MSELQYEVGFIRHAIFNPEDGFSYHVHWKGWTSKRDETVEKALSIAGAGDALSEFWVQLATNAIYHDRKNRSKLSAPKAFIDRKMQESRAFAREQQNPGPVNPHPYRTRALTPANVDPNSSEIPVFDPPYPNIVVLDPQVLWLPPDRVGLAVHNLTLLYKAACNGLGSAGIDGSAFYKHVKKDRKEFAQDWFRRAECILCSDIQICSITSCACRAKGYCAECTVQLIKDAREKSSSGKVSCPCCRAQVYLVALEWLYVFDTKTADEHNHARRRSRRKARKIWLHDHPEVVENCLEEGEIQE